MGPAGAILKMSREVPLMTQQQAADLRALVAELTRSGQHAEAAAVASLLD
jgi:hypothetical protein